MIDLIRKPIEGFPNYEVDRYGNVYSVDHTVVAVRKDGFRFKKTYKGRKLRPGDSTHGYRIVILKNAEGEWKTCAIHRLVAKAFIPNPQGLPFINHKNETRTNNCVENLEWCTNEYNCNYGNAQLHNIAGRKPVMAKRSGDTEWTTYASIREASLCLGIKQSEISRVCHEERNHYHSYSFKFANPEDRDCGNKTRSVKCQKIDA